MYLLSITRTLRMLYGGSTYDTEIAKIIVSASTVDMLTNIFDLLNLDDKRYNCDYYEDRSTFQVKWAQNRRSLCKETINLNEFLIFSILSGKTQTFRPHVLRDIGLEAEPSARGRDSFADCAGPGVLLRAAR